MGRNPARWLLEETIDYLLYDEEGNFQPRLPALGPLGFGIKLGVELGNIYWRNGPSESFGHVLPQVRYPEQRNVPVTAERAAQSWAQVMPLVMRPENDTDLAGYREGYTAASEQSVHMDPNTFKELNEFRSKVGEAYDRANEYLIGTPPFQWLKRTVEHGDSTGKYRDESNGQESGG